MQGMWWQVSCHYTNYELLVLIDLSYLVPSVNIPDRDDTARNVLLVSTALIKVTLDLGSG